MPTEDIASAVVRVLGPDSQPVGMGVLATPDQVLTCAHVVSRALGTSAMDSVRPAAVLQLDFPLVAGEARCAATVSHWQPAGADWSGDLAVLRLSESPPGGARPARVVATERYWDLAYGVFGCPPRLPSGAWASGRMRAPQADGLVQLAGDEGDHQITHGFSGAPVYVEELGGVVGLAIAVEGDKARTAYLKPTSSLLDSWPELRRYILPPCPYPGLRAFDETDAPVFFGRDAEADDLTARILSSPLVAVVGPSGCGKSSLVFAGVLPRLRRRADVAFVSRRPGRGSAADVLSTALAPLLGPYASETVRAAERAGFSDLIVAGRLAELVDRVLEKNEQEHLVLYIDQFEEGLSADTNSLADDLLALLLGSAGERLHVVLSLRSDALDTLLTGRTGHRLQDTIFLLGPLTDDGLRAAIERPVTDLGAVRFQGRLIERIIADSGTAANRIALVQFTLERLWHRQHNGELTHDAYQELGGVAGALATYAEHVWNKELSGPDHGPARRLLTQMVYPARDGTYVRRMAYRTDFTDDPGIDRVAQKLASTRLVVSGRDELGNETYDLAHESLITGWKRLSGWLEEDHGFRVWQEGVRQERQRWQESGSEAAALLRGSRLNEANNWLSERGTDIAEPERQFVAASNRAHRAAVLRRRLATVALVLLTVAAVIAATVALSQSRALVRSNDQLNASLATSAAELLVTRSEQVDRASIASTALLAAAAYRTANTEATRSALLHQYLRLRHTDRVLLEGHGDIRSFSISQDGRRMVAIAGAGDTLLQVDTARPGAKPVELGSLYYQATVSADGEYVASYRFRDGVQVRRYGSESARTLWKPSRTDTEPSLALSADGRNLLVAHSREGLVAFDVPTGKRLRTLAPTAVGATDSGVRLAPDGETAIVFRADGKSPGILLWNVRTGERHVLIDQLGGGAEIAVSADGSAIMRCDYRKAEIWDVNTRRKTRETDLDGSCPIAIGPGGRYLVSPSLGPWVLNSRERLGLEIVDPVTRQTRPIDLPITGKTRRGIMFAGNTNSLDVVAHDGGSSIVRLELTTPTAFERALNGDPWGIALDEAGRFAVTIDSGGAHIRLWDVGSGRQITKRRLGPDTDYGPFGIIDGKVLTFVGDQTIQLYSTPDLEPIGRFELPVTPGFDAEAVPFNPTEVTGEDHGRIVFKRSYAVSMWDLNTMRQVGKPTPVYSDENATIRPGHPQAAVEFSTKRQQSQPGIVLWDFVANRPAGRLPINSVRDVKLLWFDPTGTVLAVVTGDGALELWDVDRMKRLGPQLESINVQSILAFPNRNTLITSEVTQSSTPGEREEAWLVVRDLRNTAPGRDTVTLRMPSTMNPDLGLTSDGRALILVAREGEVLTVPRDPDAWLADVCRVIDRDLNARERNLLPNGSFAGNPCA